MDLMTAISTASHAVGLVKQIKDLDKALDEAVFKSQMLELHEAILEVKTALLEAKSNILERDERIKELERALKATRNEESCPKCQIGSMQFQNEWPHPTFGEVGVMEQTFVCTNGDCGFSRKKMHDPIGLLNK